MKSHSQSFRCVSTDTPLRDSSHAARVRSAHARNCGERSDASVHSDERNLSDGYRIELVTSKRDRSTGTSPLDSIEERWGWPGNRHVGS
jgi:hypothetical protein